MNKTINLFPQYHVNVQLMQLHKIQITPKQHLYKPVDSVISHVRIPRNCSKPCTQRQL